MTAENDLLESIKTKQEEIHEALLQVRDLSGEMLKSIEAYPKKKDRVRGKLTVERTEDERTGKG